MHQSKCYPCNKLSVVTHEECIKQAMCQDESMQQARCYPCNKPSVMKHELYIQQAKCQEKCMQQANCYPYNISSDKRNTCSNQVLTIQ